MIEYNDMTLIETNGNYNKVVELMKSENCPTWMLRSKIYVHTDSFTGIFVINFWDDGRIIIDDMIRPALLEMPSDDIVELSKWATGNGWKVPEPSAKLTENPRMYEFWERQYQAGRIISSVLEQKETELIERIQKSSKKEEEQ